MANKGKAVPIHHTKVDTEQPFDGPEFEARLKNGDVKAFPLYFAWHDGTEPPEAKSHWKMGHHLVDENGKPGAASYRGCVIGIAELNGARGGVKAIPEDEFHSVYEHLAAHIRDAKREPPPLKRGAKSMTDVIASQAEVLTDATESDSSPRTMRARFKGAVANVVNANRRLYPLSVLQDAVSRLKRKLPVVGEMPHPKPYIDKGGRTQFESDPSNGAIKIVDVFMDANTVWFDAEILDTSKGKDLKVYVDNALPVGCSIRMLGQSVQRMIDGIAVDVATELDILTWDVVGNPATEGCGLEKVLTDAQIADLQSAEVIEDAIATPCCPHDGSMLTPQDPDNDNDVDFLTCPKCGGVFLPSQSLSQTTIATFGLSQLTPSDMDAYPLALEWLERSKNGGSRSGASKAHMADSARKDGDKMDIEQILEALKSPEARAVMADVVKPALDAAEEARKESEEARKEREEARKEREAREKEKADADEKGRRKKEAADFIDTKLGEVKEKHGEKVHKAVKDAVGEPDTKEEAQARFESAMKMHRAAGEKAFADSAEAGARNLLDSVGFSADNATQQGRVRIEMGDSPKPWKPIVDKLCAAMDDIGLEKNVIVDEKLRAYNRKNVLERACSNPYSDYKGRSLLQLIEDRANPAKLSLNAKTMTDAIEGGQIMSDAIGVTTEQLLNQPTILTSVIVQRFQDCESLQFLLTDIFKGSEWRQPVETYTGADTYDSQTFLQDLVIGEGIGIPSSTVNLAWQSFSPRWRRNAVTLTSDVIHELQSGPLSYGAIARAIYHISQAMKRRLDDLAYFEMILSSDEYLPAVQTNESPVAASVVSTGLPAGSNAGYMYVLHPTYTTSSASYVPAYMAGYSPVVRPRSVNQIQANGSITPVTTNAFTVKVNGTALQIGAWDGVNIQNIGNTTAQYAVDFEHGIVYFMPTATSGVNPTAGTPVLPVISYSASTNFDRWTTTSNDPDGDTARYNDLLLLQIDKTAALMGSSPRFAAPNIAIFSRTSATYVTGSRIMYRFASPKGTALLDTGNTFATRDDVNYSKINAPWVAGDGRILLTRKGATRYGIETPYKVEGPFPQYDTSGNMIAAKGWYGEENSVMATPVVKDSNGNIINPWSRTVVLNS